MKTLMLISNGFEEIEAITVIDILRRCDIEVDVASITGSREITGAHDIKMVTDTLIEDLNAEGYDGLLLPGGLPNAHNLRDDERVINLVKEYDKNGKVLAAICAAPCILERAGVLKTRMLLHILIALMKAPNYKSKGRDAMLPAVVWRCY